MRDKSDAQPTSSSDASPEGRLDSWKEIAAYLSRGIRTVQRWEREEGLPVHRLVHEKRGSIYARKDELAAWWESRRQTLANPVASEPDRPPTPRLERITRAAATTSWPALSSDARLLAYVSDAGQDGTPPQIWIQQIGGSAMRLTSGEREYSSLSFSPDDTRIVFTAADATGPARVRDSGSGRRTSSFEVIREQCAAGHQTASGWPMCRSMVRASESRLVVGLVFARSDRRSSTSPVSRGCRMVDIWWFRPGRISNANPTGGSCQSTVARRTTPE